MSKSCSGSCWPWGNRNSKVSDITGCNEIKSDDSENQVSSQAFCTGQDQSVDSDDELVKALKAQADHAFRRKNAEVIGEIYKRFADPETRLIMIENFPKALKALDIDEDLEDDIASLFHTMDVNNDNGLDLEEFHRAVEHPTPAEQWAANLQLSQLLASCLPRKPGVSTLQVASSLSERDIDSICKVYSTNLKTVLLKHSAELRQSFSLMQEKAALQASEGVSKFSINTLSCGTIDDFYKGLRERVGYPHVDFLRVMEAEHCDKAGADRHFKSTNYLITTTPRQEWLVVVGQRLCPPEHRGHGRVIPNLRALRALPVAEALIDAEILALVLYTGPMFQMYNGVLRRWPVEVYEVLRAGGNLFATTIHVLASAVHKVGRGMKLPDGLRLYRGLGARAETKPAESKSCRRIAPGPVTPQPNPGKWAADRTGLMDLPECFWKADGQGCRGYAEWGFMSTTASKEVALRYSGVREGRPRAMVLEMRAGAVDRGACIRDFSQYPAEVEYLWVPCSFLAPAGAPRLEATADGPVTVVPVRANLNLRTATVEELAGQKKAMHLASFDYLRGELRGELDRLAAAPGAAARWERDASRGYMTMEQFVDGIAEEVNEVFRRHQRVPEGAYAADETFRPLALEPLACKECARAKLRWYLDDESQMVEILRRESLPSARRGLLAFLEASLPPPRQERAAVVRPLGCVGVTRPDGPAWDQARCAAALELCRARGWVREVAAARGGLALRVADGGVELEGLRLAREAGADVDLGFDEDGGRTLLMMAADAGDAARVRALCCELGADLERRDDDGFTALVWACKRGRQAAALALLDLRADANVAADGPRGNGWTALILAAANGLEAAVRALAAAGARLDQGDHDGDTPLRVARLCGHTRVAHLLEELGAPDPDLAESAVALSAEGAGVQG